MTKWLLELNPDVKGSSLNADPKSVIDTNPDYFRNNEITLVIATQLNEAVTAKLARYALVSARERRQSAMWYYLLTTLPVHRTWRIRPILVHRANGVVFHISLFCSLLASLDVPLLLVRSYGLMGFVRIQTSSYAILETFPDQQVTACRRSVAIRALC